MSVVISLFWVCRDCGGAATAVEGALDDVHPLRITDRRQLLQQLDSVPRTLEKSKFRDWNRTYQQAYGLITDLTARQAFDLTRESGKTRQRYGQSAVSYTHLTLPTKRIV